MNENYQTKDSVTTIKGVGSSTSEKLTRLGIETIADLLNHFPSRYYDFTQPVLIKNLEVGKTQSFIATIGRVTSFFSKSGKLFVQATAKDTSGKIILTWFNNPFIKRLIKEDSVYTIAGKASFWGKGLTVIAPIIEEGNTPSINTSGLVPIYPQTEGITSRWLRNKIHLLLTNIKIPDPLTAEIVTTQNLLSEEEAYKQIHFPKTTELHWQADKRLSFNEHLRININNRLELQNLGESISITLNHDLTKKTKIKFPFKLTHDQENTVGAIYKDLQSNEYTHRLIQGDTGSGKTATIIFAANQCLKNNKSCALMAPTEILAEQHYHTFLSYSLFPDQVQLITGSHQENVRHDKPMIYIGTHSLLTGLPQKLKHPLAFVAIDEQHKFGVKQRDELVKRTPVPHLFNLSATPIPRTVALGLLGDINISNITHKPINRKPTKTFVVSPTYFRKSPDWLRQQLADGSQIFVVCPNIQDHETGVASVEKISKIYQKMTQGEFPVLTIHGKMKSGEQNKVLSTFRAQGRGVLVSTSLIEVGIDIPSANIMIIHSAERFGLASLHQLRGRVGRGEEQGYCFLVPTEDDEEETERLQLLQKYKSGLILAQKDLRLRGAGEVFGTKQHGNLPTRLKYFWSKKLFLEAKQLSKSLVHESPENALRIASKLETC
jgi:ATP-dependent DNA helicase RecG